MNKRSWIMLLSVWLAVGVTATVLLDLQSKQRLGKPGLRLSAEPVKDTKGQPVGTNSVFMPPELLGYKGQSLPIDQIMLDMLPRDTTYGQRRYSAQDGFWIDSTVVLMGSDRSSIHKPQFCLVGQGWAIERSTMSTFRIDKPHAYDLPVMKLDVSKEVTLENGKRQKVSGVYIYWFVSGDQLTADHVERQWWMARDLLTRGILQRWAYVTYFSVCYPGLEQTTFERMKNFISEAVPQFQEVQGPPAVMASAGAAK